MLFNPAAVSKFMLQDGQLVAVIYSVPAQYLFYRQLSKSAAGVCHKTNAKSAMVAAQATDLIERLGAGYPERRPTHRLEINEVLMLSKTLHNNNLQLIRHNTSLVKKLYPDINRARIQALRELTKQFSFSFATGDVIQLGNSWFVTHTGLVRLARRKRCRGIHVEAVDSLCDSSANRFVLKATVYPSKDSAGFVGYGDADPSNVSLLVRGAEMRIAETRAVNRALRKAYGIGICSVEEIGSNPGPMATAPDLHKSPPNGTNGNGHKVRDRLCQIIRQYQLDPELVKAYAVDFCGTKALKDATREQVESFVQQLADAAKKDRTSLLCQLNSYARSSQEVAV